MTLAQFQSLWVAILPVIVIALVLVGAFVAGLVLLTVRGGPTARRVATAAALALLGVLALLLAALVWQNLRAAGPPQMKEASVAVVETPRNAARPAAAASDSLIMSSAGRAPQAALASPTRWHPAAELLPDATADLYPSQHDAEQAVAAAVAKAYAPTHAERPAPLRLYYPDDRSGDADYQPLADAIRQHGRACTTPKPQVQNHTHQYGLEIQITPTTADRPIGSVSARDDHQRSTDARPFAFTARFVDKPWLTDLAAQRLLREQPDLCAGVGQDFESTEAEAETAALRAVAVGLAQRIALDISPDHHLTVTPYPDLDEVVTNLRELGLIEDRFTQRLERPYGSVYRHAVLVDATPQHVRDLYLNAGIDVWTDATPAQQLADLRGAPARAATSRTGVVHPHHEPPAVRLAGTGSRAVFLRVLSLGVLVALTLLIYRFLDHWTRGYRRGMLIAVTITIILVGAVLLSYLASSRPTPPTILTPRLPAGITN